MPDTTFSIGMIKDIDVYNLITIGSTSVSTKIGGSLASYAEIINALQNSIALFRSI